MRSRERVFAVGRGGRPQVGTEDRPSLPGCRCYHGGERRTPLLRKLQTAMPRIACLLARSVQNLNLSRRRGFCAAMIVYSTGLIFENRPSAVFEKNVLDEQSAGVCGRRI